MKSALLKFVVAVAALCDLAALLLCILALAAEFGGIEAGFIADIDPPTALVLLLLALGVLLARFRTGRLPGRLISALAGLAGAVSLVLQSGVAPATAAAVMCYGVASLLFLIRRYDLGQGAAALAFLPSLGSVIGHLLGTHVLFGLPSEPALLVTVLCGVGLLGGTAHRGSIRVFLSETISGRFARKQILISTLVPVAFALFFAHLLPVGGQPLALAETVAAIIVMAWITIGITALVGRRLDIQRHRAEAELRSMARHDPLTGLLNRRSMSTALPQRHAEARAERQPITLMMCDLDHFKNLNDEYGHAVGDDVLKRTAQRVAASVRDSDLVFRYGGEEIAVLLDCGAADALRIAEKIRESVKAPTRRAGDVDLPAVTISIGAATSTRGKTALDQILTVADECLYTAKNAGRDCVRHATLP